MKRKPARRSTVDNPAILDVEGVRVLLGLKGRTSVYEVLDHNEDFPKPFRPIQATGHPRWWRREVEGWMERHYRPSQEKETA